MTDARLRDLERRFRQSGSPDDEASFLMERVRLGELREDRARLAAYVGHDAAGRATGERERDLGVVFDLVEQVFPARRAGELAAQLLREALTASGPDRRRPTRSVASLDLGQTLDRCQRLLGSAATPIDPGEAREALRRLRTAQSPSAIELALVVALARALDDPAPPPLRDLGLQLAHAVGEAGAWRAIRRVLLPAALEQEGLGS